MLPLALPFVCSRIVAANYTLGKPFGPTTTSWKQMRPYEKARRIGRFTYKSDNSCSKQRTALRKLDPTGRTSQVMTTASSAPFVTLPNRWDTSYYVAERDLMKRSGD